MRVKRTTAVVVVGIVVLVVAEVSLSTVAVWDGHFQLTLNIHSRSAAPIKDVAYGLYNRDVANFVVQQVDKHAGELRSVEIADDRIVASVPCSGRRWCSIDYGYVEPYRFIVLRLQYNDKDPFCTMVEIPGGRGPRSVNVEVP